MIFKSKKELSVIRSRYTFFGFCLLLTFLGLGSRLWFLQIYRGPYFAQLAKNNHIRKIDIPAQRGIIYDRHHRIILTNHLFYDLVLFPQFVKDEKKTLFILSSILHDSVHSLKRRLKNSRGLPKYQAVVLKNNLTQHQVSLIESYKSFIPGVDVSRVPRRNYVSGVPVHLLGYLNEIDRETLKIKNKENPDNPYNIGDLIGKQGVEKKWEQYLRGRSGYRYIQVDALGRKHDFGRGGKNTSLLEVPSTPGSDIVLTIDKDLQEVTQNAFKGKYGAVVVMDPNNGEILAMVSSPTYDPSMYQGYLSIDRWQSLLKDPYKPLFDKTTGGTFPPGSLFKPLVALAALEEGIINKHSKYSCHGSYQWGKDKFHCHKRSGHGLIDLSKALTHSCDVYFYNLGLELGVSKIAKYATAFALGEKLGLDLNWEEDGHVPYSNLSTKDLVRKKPARDILPLSIGQGANLVTPVQLASLYATIANGGTVWKPTLLKKIISPFGELVEKGGHEKIKDVGLVSEANFKRMQKLLEILNEGTGRKAYIPGIPVAGKTGSVQVVSLKKNRDRRSVVSMKWQEHAMFAAFSPIHQARVVVVVISENDTVGGGGQSTAPIAKKILEAYWKSQKIKKFSRHS